MRTQTGCPGQMDGIGSHALLDEIAARLQKMTHAAYERGEVLLPPLLVLGTCERVGSNWISDTLRPMLGQHNEPFRQQLAADHPLSPLNPRLTGFSGGDLPALGHLGRHWLVTFATSKYGTTRQAVKETNLFFAVPALLTLLPGAPVLVLSRSPLGVASSFARSRLFARWGYRARYQQMIAMTSDRSGGAGRFSALVPDDDPLDLVALARLHVLNTVLLADALAGLSIAHIPYEAAVNAPGEALAVLTAVVPKLGQMDLSTGQAPDFPETPLTGDDLFVAAKVKVSLAAHLDVRDAELIRATTMASLNAAQAVASAHVAARAAAWLAGDHLYRPEPRQQRPAVARTPQPEHVCEIVPRYVRRGGLAVRNLLVSNAEYATFLNALAQAGMPNSHGGTYLLACEMPHERGGRLHYDTSGGRWEVSPGYVEHPAYWVTWIGAATLAAWHGARLPTRAELIKLTGRASATANAGNVGYRHGDVTPVTEPGRHANEIHHLLGNLQVWCADGPPAAQGLGGPAARWLYGAAWNTPAAPQEARRARHRHILGCSRGVGIRLVRGSIQKPTGVGDLATLLTAWISSLADRSRPLAGVDERLVQALDASQADAGLGTHVASGTGEPGHG